MGNKKIMYKNNNYVVRNSNETDDHFASRILNLLLKDIYELLKQKDLYNDTEFKFKFLHICKMIIKNSIKENSSEPIFNKILSIKLIKKDILLEYSKYYISLTKNDVKDTLSYYIDMYTNSYEGFLDSVTVRSLYTKKYDRIFEKIDENNIDMHRIKKQIVNNFYAYKNTIRGYERKEFKKYNLQAKKIISNYERTLSKEDSRIIRMMCFNLFNKYIKDDKTIDFDTYFVNYLLHFDLEQAKEISLKVQNYKDNYEVRNVLAR